MEIKVWRCKNCGHEEQQHPNGGIAMLNFQCYSTLTSSIRCPGCGAYTIQRAWDETFTAGYFLLVVPKNGIRGKG